MSNHSPSGKRNLKRNNHIDRGAETVFALDNLFKQNPYAATQLFRIKVRVINITKFQGYMMLNMNDSSDGLLTAICPEDNPFNFQVSTMI